MAHRRYVLFALMMFSIVYDALAQRDSTEQTAKSGWTLRKKGVLAALIVDQAASAYLEYKWWWEGDYHSFVFESDGWFNNYSLGIDKAGHVYTSYLYYTGVNEVMKWAEFSKRSRQICSISIPLLYALSIEIGDGFTSFNFSLPDFAANITGVAFGVLQEEVPYMKNFALKFSYFPSPGFYKGKANSWNFVEDYDGHIYWLTMNPYGLFKGTSSSIFPRLFNIGIGYGVNKWQSSQIEREFFIGLDFNLNAIPTKRKAVRNALSIMDKFHWFAPGYMNRAGKTEYQWFMH